MTSMSPEVSIGATRVLIVDDHRMFVDSLVRLLEDETDLAVVGVASTIAEALRSVRRQRPDVVLLDYRLPDGDAPACIAELRDLAPDARVLVMTGLGDDATLAAAREAGCAGVVTKDKAAQDLVEGLRAVAAGQSMMSAVAAPRTATGDRRVADPGLTAREREVLEELAAGKSTAAIATSLHISPVTVRNHVQRILAKLDARSRLEAVALAIRAGIIAPPPARGTTRVVR
jgi:DNA-binding NarL/FixJ family response regulator